MTSISQNTGVFSISCGVESRVATALQLIGAL